MAEQASLVLRDCCARYVRHCLDLDREWARRIYDGNDYEYKPEHYAAGIHDNALVLLGVMDGKPCPWCERGVPEEYLAAMEAIR